MYFFVSSLLLPEAAGSVLPDIPALGRIPFSQTVFHNAPIPFQPPVNYVLHLLLLLLQQQLMGISRHLSLPFFSWLMSLRQRNPAQLKSDASHQLT